MMRVERFLGTETIEGIRLKSGLAIDCQAIVIAVGTVPNIDIGKVIGLKCKRGVVVDEYLQTNDPAFMPLEKWRSSKDFYMALLPPQNSRLILSQDI